MKMIDVAEVYLWGTKIGNVYMGEFEEYAKFEYDKSFQKSGIQLSPIMMPLSNKIYSFPSLANTSFRGLAGLVADSLPDKFGNAIISRWLASKGRSESSFTAVERLCYTGKRGMGALEYSPAMERNSISGEVDISEMTRLASSVLSQRTETTLSEENMNKMQLLEIGSSAGGARAKAIVAWNKETGVIKSGQIDTDEGFDYWLIKFDGVSGNGDHELTDPQQYTLIEYAYYLMAKKLNINMSECQILEKHGFHHFMTKRFDRVDGGNKLHMQTLSALGHFDYNQINSCSYEQYVQIARQLKVGKKDIEQIYMRMMFAVYGMNCDDHVKNFSFLMDKKGIWSISPAYDITFAYAPDNRWLAQHQMSINQKCSNIKMTDLLNCGKAMGLSTKFCKSVIYHTIEVVSNWQFYAEKSGISEERMETIDNALKVNLEAVQKEEH
ncbi:MAG: type II toxin-antitoxin system HipA family toxin [Oscillospiraceae bacterium]